MKEKSEQQKAIVRNEFKRKYSEDYYQRKQQEREDKRNELMRQGKRICIKGGGAEHSDIATALKYLEEKKNKLQTMLLPVDIEVHI